MYGAGDGPGKGRQEGGAGARWGTQSPSRSGPRRPVRRQPFFRSRRSRTGSLRDGPAPRGGRPGHQRIGGKIRGVATDLLQGAGGPGDLWSYRLASGSTRAKRGTQALGRDAGLRCRSPDQHTGDDHGGTVGRDRAPVRDQAPSTQPGARRGAQKKMTRAGPAIGAAQLAAAYEALRAAVLSGRSSGQGGLAILIHRGLAAWIAELKPEEPP